MPAPVVLFSEDQRTGNRCGRCKCGQDHWLLEGGSRWNPVLGLPSRSFQVHTTDSYCIEHRKGPWETRAIRREKLWVSCKDYLPFFGLLFGLDCAKKWRLVTLGFRWRYVLKRALNWRSRKDDPIWQPFKGSRRLRAILRWLSLHRTDSTCIVFITPKRLCWDVCASYLRGIAFSGLLMGQLPLRWHLFCNASRRCWHFYSLSEVVPRKYLQKHDFRTLDGRNVVCMALYAYFDPPLFALDSGETLDPHPSYSPSVLALRALRT